MTRQQLAAKLMDPKMLLGAILALVSALGFQWTSPVKRLGALEITNEVQDSSLVRHVREEAARHDTLQKGITAIRLGQCSRERDPLARAFMQCPSDVRPR